MEPNSGNKEHGEIWNYDTSVRSLELLERIRIQNERQRVIAALFQCFECGLVMTVNNN